MCECKIFVLMERIEELAERVTALEQSRCDMNARLDKIESELKGDAQKMIDDFLARADISDPLAPAKPKEPCSHCAEYGEKCDRQCSACINFQPGEVTL